ncbi:DEAD/DEAH box helicase [Streptomyces sp. A0642]|uniref:SNF2-related protein n=1 Tax=Streptomyces sp. A0642 TaxID=2563100 RepID=UPI001444FE51|nr:DEAD/DEAH box helicase [Streptomyces sp. A0642]
MRQPLFSSPHGLFPCQQEGTAFAYEKRSGLLVADTGIGKSVIAMAMSALLAEDGAEDLVLLVCKQNKTTEWAEDIAAFTPLPHRIHHGPTRLRRLAADGLPHVLISTFETLRADLAHFAVPPGKRAQAPSAGPLLTALTGAQADGRRVLVVYDEISDKLRNRSSRMYKAHQYALQQLRRAQPDLRVIGLTATPLSSSWEDGFNLLRLLVPAAMPSITEFDRAVIKSRDDFGRPRYDDDGVDRFVALARPHMWRKRKTDPDVRDMFPARIEEFRKVAMRKEQADLYNAVAALQDDQEDPVPGLYTALRQIAGHPAALIHSALHGESQIARQLLARLGEDYLRSVPSAKTEELVAYISPIVHGQGDKVVVFSQFGPSVLPLLAQALLKEGIRSYLYTGEMTGPEREQARRNFRTDTDACVFLSSDAGKDGINLPEATYLVEYESALTYETRTQRLGRIDRITSTAPSITCTTLVLERTVEDRIVETMLQRNEMADRFLGDTGAVGHVGAAQRRSALVLR